MQLTPSIIADFKGGRLESFYAEAYADLLTYATRLLGEQHALMAEDIVQDTIFKSYQHRSGIVDGRQWKTYLFRLIHNAAVGIHPEELGSMETGDLERIEELCTLERLFEAIDELPERYRRLFDLSFEQGLRNEEVAELLSVSTRAVVKQKARLIDLVGRRLRSDGTPLALAALSLMLQQGGDANF